MRHLRTLLLCLCVSAVAPAALAQSAEPPMPSAAADAPPVSSLDDDIVDMEAMVVTGSQPGPGMWKISNAEGHTLWVLGTLSPLPKKMEWQSGDVEAVIASAQEVISSPGMTLSTGRGMFRSLLLVPSLLKARKNPDGKTLQEMVAAADYARWLPLKERYIGREGGVEKWRPIFAAQELYEAAMKRSGLSQANVVQPVVDRAVKTHGVAVTKANVVVKVPDPKQAIKDFQQTRLADGECFSRTLSRIEGDLDNMRARANAWAVGDIGALRTIPSNDQYGVCMAAASQSAIARKLGIDDLRERALKEWQRLAEAAIARNAVTFSTLGMGVLLEQGGIIDDLRAKGYTVEAPE